MAAASLDHNNHTGPPEHAAVLALYLSVVFLSSVR